MVEIDSNKDSEVAFQAQRLSFASSFVVVIVKSYYVGIFDLFLAKLAIMTKSKPKLFLIFFSANHRASTCNPPSQHESF